MAKFNFPRSPGTDRKNPFEDERGENPFAEIGPRPSGDENPYAASGAEAQHSDPPGPGHYVITLPNRSRRVLAFGATGTLLAVFGVAMAAAGVATQGNWTWGVGYGIPIQLIGLATSLPSWIFGSSDLRAMRAGAMDATGRRQTRIGFMLGVLGVLIGTVPVLGWCALLIAYALAI